MSIYEFSVSAANAKKQALSDYKGKVLLIVNTASKCGFTPQFTGLEELHQQFNQQGLQILGFPCNQFGKQDPDDNDQIQAFCQLNYGVSFPMFNKIKVNGKEADPLFKYLKKAAPGLLNSKAIKWNFTKFLIDARGQHIKRFAPSVTPTQLTTEIQSLLSSVE